MSNNYIAIAPHMLTWARERANLSLQALQKKISKIELWEKGEVQPTLKQLEKFAHVVSIPIGYLFLPNPIAEKFPIADFRTVDGNPIKLSINLLDTIYQCQQKQDWYTNYAKTQGLIPLSFIGSTTLSEKPEHVAKDIRKILQFSLEEQQNSSNFEETLRIFKNKIEEAGIFVMTNSVVGNNTHRHLSVDEFRGFALSDRYAPIIFINGSDSKSAQMFTLAHELAHVWLGESGISDVWSEHIQQRQNELWCNNVATEFLMPYKETLLHFNKNIPIEEQMDRLALLFKVSTLVVIRRLFDLGFIEQEHFWRLYTDISQAVYKKEQNKGSGGDFYKTLPVRTSKRFTKALLANTFEGQTLFRDAFHLLGVKNTETLTNIAKELGVFG